MAAINRKRWIIGSAVLTVVVALALVLHVRQAEIPVWRTLPLPPAATQNPPSVAT